MRFSIEALRTRVAPRAPKNDQAKNRSFNMFKKMTFKDLQNSFRFGHIRSRDNAYRSRAPCFRDSRAEPTLAASADSLSHRLVTPVSLCVTVITVTDSVFSNESVTITKCHHGPNGLLDGNWASKPALHDPLSRGIAGHCALKMTIEHS